MKGSAMRPAGRAFEFADLAVGYGDFAVLRGLSGAVRPGSLTALIGPNGGGKSTLLRAFAGLLPYKGSLRLGDRELFRIPRGELGRLVGVMPQQTRMAAPFTTYEAVALGCLPRLGLAARLSAEDERLVREAVEQADVVSLLFRPVTRLSGGETQQVMLATVLAQNAPVMLLDEPVSALDPRRTLRVFSLLRRLADEGRTVVAAVHDVNLAAAFADAFLALKSGEIVADAPIGALNEAVLQALYDTPFEAYKGGRGKKAWHARAE